MSIKTNKTVKNTETKADKSDTKAGKSPYPEPVNSPVQQILFLQQTIGNQAVQRLFNSGQIQAKLKIGRPNDIYEQEADRVAEQVMQMPENLAIRYLQSSMIQRQEIPTELLVCIDLSSMADQEIEDRYDLIVQTLIQFDQSTPETLLLEEEAGRIGVELSRRAALAAGRTFTPDAISRMQSFFITNATSSAPLSCIDTMNRGIRELLSAPEQRVGGEVQTTMRRLQRSGRAGAARVIEFNDSRGRMTTGVRRPHTLRENVWDVLLEMAGNDVGWSVFGLSLMDDYHSVILTLDNNDLSAPHVYWSDQWSSKGGWMEFNRESLNTEITRLIQGWWDDQPAGRKHRTRVTLWRLHQ